MAEHKAYPRPAGFPGIGLFRAFTLAVACLGILVGPLPAYPQITLDGTMGPSGPLTGPNYDITGNLGQIRGANLFLLNPSGILFGPNATLDVKGSFHATTADYLRFADGAVFYSDPFKTSLLSVAAPVAFGFLSSNPAGISIELSDKSSVQVPGEQTLSVIGGDIEVKGTCGSPVEIRGGRINLASVASPGEVIPNAPGEVAGLALKSFIL